MEIILFSICRWQALFDFINWNPILMKKYVTSFWDQRAFTFEGNSITNRRKNAALFSQEFVLWSQISGRVRRSTWLWCFVPKRREVLPKNWTVKYFPFIQNVALQNIDTSCSALQRETFSPSVNAVPESTSWVLHKICCWCSCVLANWWRKLKS